MSAPDRTEKNRLHRLAKSQQEIDRQWHPEHDDEDHEQRADRLRRERERRRTDRARLAYQASEQTGYHPDGIRNLVQAMEHPEGPEGPDWRAYEPSRNNRCTRW
ncbi:hypothetical protein ACIG56_17290 [Nocardia fusca]|uniref:hypothetical protein n=1 Tax=Nocardia fusca TaxID=941183 RepID=UPI0037C89411